MLYDDRKREIAICQYPTQPTIFSYACTKTAFVPHILKQLSIVAEQEAASVLWHTVKGKQKRQWEEICKWLETGKLLSTTLRLDPRSSVAMGQVDLRFGLLPAGMQNSASFPRSRYPANRRWNHLQPNRFSVSLCICCVFASKWPGTWNSNNLCSPLKGISSSAEQEDFSLLLTHNCGTHWSCWH